MLVYLLIFICAFLFSLLWGFEIAYSLLNKIRHNLDPTSSDGKIFSFLFRNDRRVYSSLWFACILLFIAYQFFFFSAVQINLPTLFLGVQILISVCGSILLLFVVLDLILRLLFKVNIVSIVSYLSLPASFLVCLFAPVYLFVRRVRKENQWRLSVNGIFAEIENLNSGKQVADTDREDYKEEVKMFRNALDFSNVMVGDCMVPRTEIVSLDVEASVDELREILVKSNCSRIVVFKENIDNVLGYVHSLDMFDSPHEIKDMLNPLPVVQETLAANKMLKIFLQEHKGMALVVDEFGGTSGIVTLEDIMEEIFGEIEDEHDRGDGLVAKRLSKNEFVLSGRLEIEDVNERFDLHLPISDDYITIGGLILSRNYVLPKPKDVVRMDDFCFTIIKTSSTKIDVVNLKIGA